jgi:hypothetical protein
MRHRHHITIVPPTHSELKALKAKLLNHNGSDYLILEPREHYLMRFALTQALLDMEANGPEAIGFAASNVGYHH